jgi:hypothetical protein
MAKASKRRYIPLDSDGVSNIPGGRVVNNTV